MELVDVLDSKSCEVQPSCRFDPGHRQIKRLPIWESFILKKIVESNNLVLPKSKCNKNFASGLKLAKYIFRGISIMWRNLYLKKLHRRKV